MKIGILTQPLASNYGGLLQAWALQRTLYNMGHEAIIINRVYNPKHNRLPLWRRPLSFLKNELYITLGKRKRYLPVTKELKDYSEKYVSKFRHNRYRGISPDILTDQQLLDYVNNECFERYIVGSDQVWRPMYSPNLMTYFLDFARDNNKVKKIAYAASFGVDEWEFTKKQTLEAADLAKLFDVITVRESSAVKLVRDFFGCEATHVLDPTMLLDRKDYMELVDNPTCNLHESDGEVFCYVLDKSPIVSSSISECAKHTGYKPFFCNYEVPFNRLQKNSKREECIVPPVEQWIKSFSDAKMVVTDSFHGTVFSIIFNKPFWVVANENRGVARFKSLLKQFGLENRIIKSDSTTVDWNQPINWNNIDPIREKKKNYSRSLLFCNL